MKREKNKLIKAINTEKKLKFQFKSHNGLLLSLLAYIIGGGGGLKHITVQCL